MFITNVLTAETDIKKFEMGAAYNTGSFTIDSIKGTKMTPPPTPEDAARAPPTAQSAVRSQSSKDKGQLRSVGVSALIPISYSSLSSLSLLSLLLSCSPLSSKKTFGTGDLL